jgi:hypothetical protein
MSNRIAQIRAIQEKMSAAMSTPGDLRAQLLREYADSDVFPARQAALEELGKTGPSGVATIRQMLDDTRLGDEKPDLIQALANAGGDAVRRQLNSLLENERLFGRSVGPSLSQDWWNEDTRLNAPPRMRYSETYQILIALQKLSNPASNSVRELPDVWSSFAALSKTSSGQIEQECEKLIATPQTD